MKASNPWHIRGDSGQVYLRKAVNMLPGAIKYGEERWMYHGDYIKCKQY